MREELDIKFAGMSLWVLGRQFPDLDDYWDGNWLNVQVRVEASGAAVEAAGPIIHVGDCCPSKRNLNSSISHYLEKLL